MIEHNDEFFINLVMKLSEKDQELYNTWAVWCDESGHQYHISSRFVNGEIEYFTKERVKDEVQLLRKIDAFRESIDNLNLDMRKAVNKEYVELAEKFIESGSIAKLNFIPYEKFVEYKSRTNQ